MRAILVDFSLKGVTSISVDVHKYGYAAKGASVILYRSRSLRKFQFSIYTDWSGGVYGSTTMLGSKPGGAIAAAWAAINAIGEDGYLIDKGLIPLPEDELLRYENDAKSLANMRY